MSRGLKITLAVLGALLVLAGLCCVGTLLIASDDANPAVGSTLRAGAGGFALEPPPSFKKKDGPGRWRLEQRDGTEVLWVDVTLMQPIAGLDGADAKLATLWTQQLTGAYENVRAPLVQRRFVSNGARSHYARAKLTRPGNREPVMVSLYLVEADDHLEPFFVMQGCDTNEMGVMMIIEHSFPKTHVSVEDLLTGVRGSPVGVPLVSDEELTGHFQFGDSGTAEWMSVSTGGLAVTAVMRAADYTFNDDHTYTYSFTGGSGVAGNLKFQTEKDQGTWRVEHDVLVTTGEKREQKYLLTGAPRSPQGAQVLMLQPAPGWSQGPNSENEVWVRQE
jgi:hypothetical protein